VFEDFKACGVEKIKINCNVRFVRFWNIAVIAIFRNIAVIAIFWNIAVVVIFWNIAVIAIFFIKIMIKLY
jgi:hypothetical protein